MHIITLCDVILCYVIFVFLDWHGMTRWLSKNPITLIFESEGKEIDLGWK